MSTLQVSADEAASRVEKAYNGTIVLDKSSYKGMKKKAHFKCLKCGYEWDREVYSIISSKTGCKNCRKNKQVIPAEVIAEKINKKFDGRISLITETYIDTHKKSDFVCNVCGYKFRTTAHSIMRSKKGCPMCTHSIKLTADDASCEVEKVHGNKIALIKESYINTTKKAEYLCNICGKRFYATTAHVLHSKSGCPYCAGVAKLPLNDAIERVNKASGGLVVINDSTYTVAGKPCELICKVCGYTWKTTIIDFCRKGRCPYCTKRIKVNVDEAIKRINEKHNGSIIIVDPSKYVNTKEPVLLKCLKCFHEWYTAPCEVYNGTGCPVCFSKKLENPIIHYLEHHKCKFVFNKALQGCRVEGSNHCLRPDFKFIDVPLIIEADGQQHFNQIQHIGEDLQKIQLRDSIKNNYCKGHDITLIRVTSSPTKEWGTDKHITMQELFDLFKIGINEDGSVNLDVFKPYDFNRD